MIVFYLFAILLVYYSLMSLTSGVRYYRFFRKELQRPISAFTPFASVIAPCRGFEAGLEANLSALFELDYPRFEVVFVVDDPADAAVPVIERVSRGRDARLVVAGRSEEESQKVHNLREAVRHVSEESRVFVFVDSDVRPSRGWMRSLVAPLENEGVGAATGYRWFFADRGGLASAFRSVWNASIASALGPRDSGNFCWGGSTAILREVFDRLDVRERWRGTLSDDFALTRALNDAGLAIRFVPQALTASVEDCTLRELVEFTTRQMKITRVYRPHLWKATLMGSFLFNLVLFWGLGIVLAVPAGSPDWWFAVAGLSLVWGLSIGKAYIRQKAAGLALAPYRRLLETQLLAQLTLWALTPALFLFNSIAALISREIVWRGIRYRMTSPSETQIIK